MDDDSTISHEDQRRLEPAAPASQNLAALLSLTGLQARTPARILTGRAGAAYRTATWLELRADHAAARDAVHAELDLERDLGALLVARWGLFEVSTQATTKREFLLHPELGRSLSDRARSELIERCPTECDFQVAIADGLSATAVREQVPVLLPLLAAEAMSQGWRLGQPFVVRHGRVGILNNIGEILNPTIVVLLIGERPGLATTDSLSAYMAFRPRQGHDDAHRNVISNIHERGITAEQAVPRIIDLVRQMVQLETSGVAIKERSMAALSGPSILES
jgi:ethanolamine ammonia-lyase small subunit